MKEGSIVFNEAKAIKGIVESAHTRDLCFRSLVFGLVNRCMKFPELGCDAF